MAVGRPPLVITEKQRTECLAYAKVGVSQHDIAKLMKISHVSLLKYFQEELDLGKAQANAAVCKRLFATAMGSDRNAFSAQVFWLKTQAGWKENANEEGGLIIRVLGGLPD
jgi:hypothetical protein